jgi:hypothetical protein
MKQIKNTKYLILSLFIFMFISCDKESEEINPKTTESLLYTKTIRVFADNNKDYIDLKFSSNKYKIIEEYTSAYKLKLNNKKPEFITIDHYKMINSKLKNKQIPKNQLEIEIVDGSEDVKINYSNISFEVNEQSKDTPPLPDFNYWVKYKSWANHPTLYLKFYPKSYDYWGIKFLWGYLPDDGFWTVWRWQDYTTIVPYTRPETTYLNPWNNTGKYKLGVQVDAPWPAGSEWANFVWFWNLQ